MTFSRRTEAEGQKRLQTAISTSTDPGRREGGARKVEARKWTRMPSLTPQPMLGLCCSFTQAEISCQLVHLALQLSVHRWVMSHG